GHLPTPVRRDHGADPAAYQEADPRSRRGPEHPPQARVAVSRSFLSRMLTVALIAGSLWAFGYRRRTIPQPLPAVAGSPGDHLGRELRAAGSPSDRPGL